MLRPKYRIKTVMYDRSKQTDPNCYLYRIERGSRQNVRSAKCHDDQRKNWNGTENAILGQDLKVRIMRSQPTVVRSGFVRVVHKLAWTDAKNWVLFKNVNRFPPEFYSCFISDQDF